MKVKTKEKKTSARPMRTSTKTSLVGAACLLAGAGAGAVGASGTVDLDGNNRALTGSDIFRALTNDFLSQFPWGHDNFITAADPTRTPRNPGAGLNAAGDGIDGTYFIGGGQSVGDNDLQRNFQQISVGTASLKNTNYATNVGSGVGWIDADGNTATGSFGGRELRIQGTTEGIVIGLDGLSILGHTTQAGSANGLAVAGKTLIVRHYVSNNATPPASLVGGSVDATGKIWTLPVAAPAVASKSGAKLLVAGASAANSKLFDIVSVSGSTITTLQAGAAETFGAGATFSAYSSRIFVVDPTTPPTTAYGATLNGDNTASYVFNNSLDVIRLLWGGLHHGTLTQVNTPNEIGTYDAGSDVRRSLADSWGTLFSGSVPNPNAKISHVWRRSDLAGATNAFVALVNFGSRSVGPLTGTGRTNPFANAGDANGRNATTGAALAAQFSVNSTATSLGGVADFADFDPIRRLAAIGPNPATTSTANVDLDQVAQNDGTLGLVLPIFPPDGLNGVQPDVPSLYPTRVATAGRFDPVDPGFIPTAANVPQGGPFSGLIFLPYNLDAQGVKHFNVIARSSHPPAFGAPVPADNRVFNLAVKNDTNGKYYKDLNNRFLDRIGYYKIHTSQSATLNTPGVPSSGVVTAKQLGGDAQEGALIVAEPYSVSYNGRGADTNPSFGGNVSALSLSGQASNGFNPAQAAYPTEQEIKNLVIAPPSATNVVYPLARRIYVNTLVGFSENPPWSREGITRATGVDPGPGTYTFNPAASAVVGGVALGANTAVRGLQGQEYLFAKAFGNSDQLGALFKWWGFVALPSAAEGFPKNGVFAFDYPEDLATNALPYNGANETGNPYAGKPVTVPPAFTNNNNEDATVVSPHEGLIGYTLSGSSPPFPYDASREPAHLPWPGSP